MKDGETKSRLRRAGMACAAAVVGSVAWCDPASAVPRTWAGFTGSWNVNANWNPAAVPGPTDTAMLSQGPFTATYDSTVPVALLAGVTISNGMSVSMNSGTFQSTSLIAGASSTAGSLTIAAGVASFTSVSQGSFAGTSGNLFVNGGSINVSSALTVGGTPTSGGMVTIAGGRLQAGSLTLAPSGLANLAILNLNSGTFNLGAGPGGTGTLILNANSRFDYNGGALQIGVLQMNGGSINVGFDATFSVLVWNQLSGLINAGVNDMTFGGGVYTLGGGNMTTSGVVTVGTGPPATLMQTAGIASFSTLGIGLGTGAGTYSLSGGQLTVLGNILVGAPAGGTFSVSNGSATMNILRVGPAVGSPGVVNLSSGSIMVNTLQLGQDGPGTFNQNGGVFISGGTPQLGFNSSGTANISGGASFSAPGMFVGGSGAGFFGQSGGVVGILNNLTISSSVGAGTYQLSSGVLNAGLISVEDGGYFRQNGGSLFAGPVAGGGTFAQIAGISNVRHIRTTSLVHTGGIITILAGGGISGTSKFSGVPMGPAKLDLNDHSMILEYSGGSPIDSVRQLLRTGTGPGAGIFSSVGLGSGGLTGIGYGEAADVLGIGGGMFAGLPADNTAVLLKYTYFGDADLDGDVDQSDLTRLAQHWQASALWSGGDFDYNGFVDVRDLYRLALNWFAGIGAPLGVALEDLGLPPVTVPEPGLGMLGMSLLLLPRRRGR